MSRWNLVHSREILLNFGLVRQQVLHNCFNLYATLWKKRVTPTKSCKYRNSLAVTSATNTWRIASPKHKYEFQQQCVSEGWFSLNSLISDFSLALSSGCSWNLMKPYKNLWFARQFKFIPTKMVIVSSLTFEDHQYMP